MMQQRNQLNQHLEDLSTGVVANVADNFGQAAEAEVEAAQENFDAVMAI